MNGFLAILGGLAMLGVVVSLFVGIFGMARGGEFNARYGNRMMRWRVMLQGLALGLLGLAMILGSKG